MSCASFTVIYLLFPLSKVSKRRLKQRSKHPSKLLLFHLRSAEQRMEAGSRVFYTPAPGVKRHGGFRFTVNKTPRSSSPLALEVYCRRKKQELFLQSPSRTEALTFPSPPLSVWSSVSVSSPGAASLSPTPAENTREHLALTFRLILIPLVMISR